MIKLVYCITRKEGMSRSEFCRTWLEDHGPLVRSFATAIRAVKYVQSHTGMDELNQSFIASRGLSVPYDGITEIWWNSVDDMQAGSGTPEGLAAAKALAVDEARFIDFSRSSVFMTEEHEIF
jgi:hypothetical protein